MVSASVTTSSEAWAVHTQVLFAHVRPLVSYGVTCSETLPMRKLPTGEPYARKPHVRFGGRGGESLPDPYQGSGCQLLRACLRLAPLRWRASPPARGDAHVDKADDGGRGDGRARRCLAIPAREHSLGRDQDRLHHLDDGGCVLYRHSLFQ